MREYIVWVSYVFLFLVLLSAKLAFADTYIPASISSVFKRAEYIRLIRITSAYFYEEANIECKYKYKTSILENFKGDAPTEFYLSEPAVVGSRYLLVGSKGLGCGGSGIAIKYPTATALHPVLPYGFGGVDDQSWVAFGGADFTFPSEVKVADGAACYIGTDSASINPCLVPPPAANLRDIKGLLRRELGSNSSN